VGNIEWGGDLGSAPDGTRYMIEEEREYGQGREWHPYVQNAEGGWTAVPTGAQTPSLPQARAACEEHFDVKGRS
jgi:hypothetical protein